MTLQAAYVAEPREDESLPNRFTPLGQHEEDGGHFAGYGVEPGLEEALKRSLCPGVDQVKAPLPDGELLELYRAAAGPAREPYVNELFQRNYSKVARWCQRFTADRESAADLAQDVFIRAYQNLEAFQGQSKFSTWLFSIARNHGLNVIRANVRQATELRGEVDEDFMSNIPDCREGAHAMLERESSARLVVKVLNDALDETENAVFTLHYGEELTLDTVTRLLRLKNRSGAKAYIVSAKRKLKRSVQQWTARGRHNGDLGEAGDDRSTSAGMRELQIPLRAGRSKLRTWSLAPGQDILIPPSAPVPGVIGVAEVV